MKKIIIGSLLLASMYNVFAGDVKFYGFTDDFKREIITSIEKNNPDMKGIQEVRETPIQNLYEIRINSSDIFYSDKDGKTLFLGSMFKSENGTKINITEQRISDLTKVDISKLNFKDAITRKIGSGKNTIITFEDPNCGYCKKIHGELLKLKNVTIHTFILPILGPKSLEVSKVIWCSKDKLKAWDDYLINQTLPEAKMCDVSALERNIIFAKEHKIRGTPTLIFKNGKIISSYLTTEQIMENINKK